MAVKFHDYYQVLGVPRSATAEEIRQAYRKLARQHHPDMVKGGGSDVKFKQINEAYEVLKDPEKRKKYDALGQNWRNGQEFTPPPDWAENVRFHRQQGGGPGFSFRTGGGQFSDFFEAIFGGGFGENSRGAGGGGANFEDLFEQLGRQRGGRRGEATQEGPPPPQEAELTLPLRDAYHGATRELSFRAPDGSTRTVRVKIPAGTTDGSAIRLRGLAPPAYEGGPAGDVLLRIHLAGDPDFEVDGADLVMDLPLSPWEAALGAKVNLNTLDGSVTLTVPPGTQSGQRLRIKGRGLPKTSDPKGPRGDLHARIRIVVPKELTDQEKELFEQLKKKSSFDPRAK